MLCLGCVQFSLLLNFLLGTVGVEQFQSGVVLSRERQTTTLTEKLDLEVLCCFSLNEMTDCAGTFFFLMIFSCCFVSDCADCEFRPFQLSHSPTPCPVAQRTWPGVPGLYSPSSNMIDV